MTIKICPHCGAPASALSDAGNPSGAHDHCPANRCGGLCPAAPSCTVAITGQKMTAATIQLRS